MKRALRKSMSGARRARFKFLLCIHFQRYRSRVCPLRINVKVNTLRRFLVIVLCGQRFRQQKT